jgi:hypothetical protein
VKRWNRAIKLNPTARNDNALMNELSAKTKANAIMLATIGRRLAFSKRKRRRE